MPTVVANGVDDTGLLTPASLRAAQKSFVCRYLTGKYAMPLAEATAYILGKIDIVSLFEVAADAALGGAGQGVIDAQSALKAAAALRQPKGSAIYVTVDVQPVTSPQLNIVIDYVRSFAAAVRASGYKAGVYGWPVTIQQCGHLVDFTFRSASDPNTIVASDLRQLLAQVTINGHACDQDVAFVADFGQWSSQTMPPKPAPPTPKPTPAATRPDAADLKTAGLRGLKNATEAAAASKAGFDLWYWNTKTLKFAAQKNGKPTGVTLYVNTKFTTPKVPKR